MRYISGIPILEDSWYPEDVSDLIPLMPYGGEAVEHKIISETIEKVISKQEENNMSYGFMKDMFGPIKGGLCRLTMDGTIAVKTANGYKSYNAATGSFVNCDNFVFDIGDEMFFVIPTNSVQTGDIILASGEPRYVLKVEDNMLTTINYKNGTVENLLPERHMFMGNTYFYGKIVSMFGNMTALSGGDGANNVMKYMMMSQMLKGGSSFGGGDSNPLMLMMLMNGGGMGNMFDGLFGTANTTPVATPTTDVKEDK